MYRRVPGIYRIDCSGNGKFYIGSAVSVFARFASHRCGLRKGRHSNRHLQNAYNPYGPDSFTYAIIEECAVDNLMAREQWWLDYLRPFDPERGMNNSPTASTSLGFRHSAATRALLSQRARERAPETRRAVADALRGRAPPNKGRPGKKWTPEQRAKLAGRCKGQKPWNAGIPMPDGVRRRIGETLRAKGINRKYTDEQRLAAQKLRAQGMSYPKIAAELGMSMATAYRLARIG